MTTDSNHVIGVDLGGTNVQVALVDGRHRIVERWHARTEPEEGLDHVLGVIAAGVTAVARAAHVGLDTIDAVGVVAAGAIDIPRGVVLSAPNLRWMDVPLRDLLGERLGRPVVIENDVNGAVWGEYRLGAGDGSTDCLGVWVGTGVGGGLVLGGSLYHGGFFTAGEIGQTVVELPPPGVEARGVILEARCSRTGMRATIEEQLSAHPGSALHALIGGDLNRLGMKELREAYVGRDALTVRVVDRAAEVLGVAIANWVTVLSLPLVIVGGGVTEALGESWLARVRRSFLASVFPARCRDCRLVMTELAGDSGLLGAALVAREAPPRP